MGPFAESLRTRIEAYYRGRYALGWRLLYSPVDVLDGARVALLGLNPGGSERPPDHAEFAMATGSAYVRERWGTAPPGQNPLQRQVRALCELLGEAPESVLAGNLVPFRSPSWEALSNKAAALTFGRVLWSEIFAHVRPALVIAMGDVTRTSVKDILRVSTTHRMDLNWGVVQGERGRGIYGDFVGLPHLSRYAVGTRAASRPALEALVAGTIRPHD